MTELMWMNASDFAFLATNKRHTYLEGSKHYLSRVGKKELRKLENQGACMKYWKGYRKCVFGNDPEMTPIMVINMAGEELLVEQVRPEDRASKLYEKVEAKYPKNPPFKLYTEEGLLLEPSDNLGNQRMVYAIFDESTILLDRKGNVLLKTKIGKDSKLKVLYDEVEKKYPFRKLFSLTTATSNIMIDPNLEFSQSALVDDSTVIVSSIPKDDIELEDMIFKAVDQQNIDQVKALLKHGVSANTRDYRYPKNTLLHILARSLMETNEVTLDILHTLLEYGADLNALDETGKTVRRVAREEQNYELSKVIDHIQLLNQKSISDLPDNKSPDDKGVDGGWRWWWK